MPSTTDLCRRSARTIARQSARKSALIARSVRTIANLFMAGRGVARPMPRPAAAPSERGPGPTRPIGRARRSWRCCFSPSAYDARPAGREPSSESNKLRRIRLVNPRLGEPSATRKLNPSRGFTRLVASRPFRDARLSQTARRPAQRCSRGHAQSPQRDRMHLQPCPSRSRAGRYSQTSRSKSRTRPPAR
jgi:hypothetical protein